MSINKTVAIGLAGNVISKKITGSDESSIGRTIVATGAGAALGAVAGAIVAGIASLFD